LNQDYQAISICSIQRAFVLVYLQKAEVVHLSASLRIHSITQSFPVPSIIKLRTFARIPYRKVALSRTNIFRRDGYSCVYCNTSTHLTIDHIIPRSLGGKDTWENLVTACQTCNTKKGNRTIEQSNMRLQRKPFRPSYIMYLSHFSEKLLEEWRPYLMVV